MFCGIPFIMNLPDRAMTELMCNDEGEPIYDRTQEHLGTSDVFVIAVRRQLLQAVNNLENDGTLPPNVDNPDTGRVRMGSFLLANGSDWVTETADRRSSDGGHPVANDVPLIIE